MHRSGGNFIRCIQQVSVRSFRVATTKLSDAANVSDVKGDLVPGLDQSVEGWTHVPRQPGRRIARMYPVRSRHRPRIVLVREGCTNRPFFTIQIKSSLSEAKQQGIEQVGSWDPFPNKTHGEQLVALNLDRIFYWLARKAEPSTRVAELLGLAGVLPVHPRSYLVAHRARLATAAFLERQKHATAPESPDATATNDTSNETTEVDPKDRPDSVWRRGREPPWWWFTGLV